MEGLKILGEHSTDKNDSKVTKKETNPSDSNRKSYEYLNKLTQNLIEKNSFEHGINEREGLNYSLSYIKNEILDDKKSIYNKKILKNFLDGRIAERKFNLELEPEIILPFTSNLSQKKALENALMYDISVIQGPPGTGKTQTILNIICNTVIKNKRVLVVSNNNSAIDNLFNFSARLGSKPPYIDIFMSEIREKLLEIVNKVSK